ISSRRASKASETYLRNTSPRITSLYWLASMEPRSLSAAFHSVSLSCFIVVAVLGVATSCCLPRGTEFLIPSRAGVRRSHHSPHVRHRLPHPPCAPHSACSARAPAPAVPPAAARSDPTPRPVAVPVPRAPGAPAIGATAARSGLGR